MSYTNIKMNKKQLLAAELFSYSYDNYADHLEVGNERFTKLMPEFYEILERSQIENWPKKKIAKELEIEEDIVEQWIDRLKIAKEIIFAKNVSESFRFAVKDTIKRAVDEGLDSDEKIEDLVIQICYRSADFGYLLNLEKRQLCDYSKWLRRDRDVDYSRVGLPNLD